MSSPSDAWSSPTDLGADPHSFVGEIPAPTYWVYAQIALSLGSQYVWWTDGSLMRVIGWVVAVLGAFAGVAYRYHYRKLSIRPEFRGLGAGAGVTWLVRGAFVTSVLAVVFTSYRASLVIPV